MNMKRLFGILAVAAAVVILPGCKGNKGPSVAPPSFDANFDMNAIQDIKDGVNGVINLSVPGKVEELTVTLTFPDATYQKLVASLIGISSNQPTKEQKTAVFDLVNDSKAISSLGATSRVSGLTACTMDLMKVVNSLTATGASNNDQFKFAIRCVDKEGQASTKTITYKWTAEPTFTWVEQKASGVEYSDPSKVSATFKILAPAGLSSVKVKVGCNIATFISWLNSNIKITANQSNSAPVLDLIEDSYAVSYVGSSANGISGKKTEVKIDLSKVLNDFVQRGAATGSVITLDFTVGDEFGRTINSETVTYKYTGAPVD